MLLSIQLFCYVPFFPVFRFKIVLFPYNPFDGICSCILPQLADRFFFRYFGMSRFVCFVLSSLDIFLVFLLSRLPSGLLFVLLVLLFLFFFLSQTVPLAFTGGISLESV